MMREREKDAGEEGQGVVRIKLADGSKLSRLIEFLTLECEAYVTQVAADEIVVGFLGSLGTDAQIAETEARLRDWLQANPDVVATLME